MARSWLMVVVFFLALLFYVLATMPARVVLEEKAYSFGGEQVYVEAVSGRVLNGAAKWRWRGLDGSLFWRIQFKSFWPAVKFEVRSTDLKLHGLASVGMSQNLYIKQVKLSANVGAFSQRLALPAGGADGSLLGEIESLVANAQGELQVQGVVHYSGGDIHWPNGSAAVGPLQLALNSDEAAVTKITLHAPGSSLEYMSGLIAGRTFEWQVYRRWIQALGMSQGGNADDVVFKVSDQW